MLTKIQIKNFRCFRDLEIAPLSRVNLITGPNNSGKTALLEALSVLWSPKPQAPGTLPNDFRSGPGNADAEENFWKWFFYQKDIQAPIELKCILSNGDVFGWRVQKENSAVYKDGRFFAGMSCSGVPDTVPADLKAVSFSTQARNPNEDAINFNRVVLKRRKKDLVNLLRPLENRLEALESLQLGGKNYSYDAGMLRSNFASGQLIYAELQGLPEMIPVIHLGQGFTRLLDIYAEILASDAQILLVDEIENGIYHGVMPTIWKGLFHAAKEADLQIFATTHSWECILAADKAAREGASYDLSLIRLDRVEGDVKATVMDEKTLTTAKELHWELR